MRLPEASSISPSVRDALAVIHRHALELIVQGASLETVLDGLCDGIDALDPDLISSVLLADPDGQRLWPKAGRRVPEDWKQFITPLPIGPSVGACGTAAFRKERVINQDIATDPLWSGAAEKYRAVALQHGRSGQKQLVKEATAIMADICGDPTQSKRTWVLLTEAAEGGWGIAGTAFGREEFAALAAAAPAAKK